MNKKQTLLISATVLSFLLSACGGGDNKTTNTSKQPHSIRTANIQNTQILASKTHSATTVTSSGDSITITYNGAIPTGDKHFQFFINTDENSSTGYQFDGEAWSETGADYLIEDNELYVSTGNNDDWNWSYKEDISFTKTTTSVSVTLNKSLLKSLSSQVRVGFLITDSNWDTEDFHPKSVQMPAYTIDTNPNNDTVAPVITLKGADVMRVTRGSMFTDPGATALDNVDGDITPKIKVLGADTIDTNATEGTKQYISYRVLDNAGNEGIASRIILLINQDANEIVVDGKVDDWLDVTPIGDNEYKMYVRDSDKALSLFVQFDKTAVNTQLYFDSDYDAATGMLLFGGTWGTSGIDYLIENSEMYKSSGAGWSWKQAGAIDYFRKEGVIELSIPKSNFSKLGSNIGIGFVKRDANWNVIPELLPKADLLTYTFNGSSPSVKIPSEARAELCNNPTQAQNVEFFRGTTFAENAFGNGFEFTGADGIKKKYMTTESNGIYTLNVELPNGTVNKIGDYDFEPYIFTIDGALYFKVINSPAHILKLFRINSVDNAVFVLQHGKSGAIPRVYYIKGTDYFVSKNRRGEKESILKKAIFDAQGTPSEVTLYNDTGNPSLDHLQVYYQSGAKLEEGTLYYAYTKETKRIIGVVNDSKNLTELSTCN